MIELKNVNYGYEKKKPVIKEINKKINPRAIHLCYWKKWFTGNQPLLN
ncbi:MAG: hypothetical protein HFJ27_02275 [Clostridia bacterium]|nr:hypothetical protein [Clostridia bacterium]